jgi:Uma2 family endonuclease
LGVNRGVPWSLSSFSDLNHQRISANLLAEFDFRLKNCNKCTVYRQIDYRVTDDTILQPDMLVVCGEITKKYLEFPPFLVAEILSPDCAFKDRHAKYIVYESQGIRHYVIIKPDREIVEIYELVDGEYKLRQTSKNIVHEFSFPECTARVDFKEIW